MTARSQPVSISIRPRHAVDLGHAAEKRPKPPVPVATDIALHLAAKNGSNVPFSYWDVWYALLADDDFEGDLDQLGNRLRLQRQGYLSPEEAEGKLSHLRDLQHRLEEAGLCLEEVLDALPPALAKAESRRAEGRILKHNQRSYELSEPMRNPPSRRLYDAALRGQWPNFPISPEPACRQLRAQFNWGRCYGEDASWGLAKKLNAETDRAKKLVSKRETAEALAALRSVLTVALELVESADDSFGCIGQSFELAFEEYLALSRKETGISPETFLTDLLELLIFEEACFTSGHFEGFFVGLTGAEADFCLAYLRKRIAALQALDLDHQAEEALTLLGQVAAERKRFDLFETLAAEMQASEWERIVRLVDAAEKAGKHELAVSVFRKALADPEGFHVDFLTKKNEQLLQGKWNPDPRK